MWTMTVPVLSTGHIKKDTISQLKEVAQVLEYDEGAFCYFNVEDPDAFVDLPELEPIADWFKKEFPDENWLRFDASGDEVKGLPVYQWG